MEIGPSLKSAAASLPDEQRRKIALFTNVEERAVISGVDADDIYKIPLLLHEEGLFVGSTSGINVAAAVRVARDLGPGHTIVTVLCDGGAKYQSRLFNREWLESKGLAAHATPARRNEPITLENVLVA